MRARFCAGVLFFCGVFALISCDQKSHDDAVDVRFSFESAALTMAEDDASTEVTIVLTSSAPTLPADVSVEAFDLGTGTATAGLDYAFATQRITFAAGSPDGATAVVLLEPLEDAVVDAPGETVELGLRGAVGGTTTGTTRATVAIADADVARVSFATANGSWSEASKAMVALELAGEPGLLLQIDVQVLVSDLGTGTSVPLADYTEFPRQWVIFPAGSAAGAIQVVSLTLLDDLAAEVDETIELGLSDPSAGCVLGAISTHVLEIDDDDLAAEAAFEATEGVTGTENELVYDESLDLGVDAVGGSPSAGTLVRVANLGGSPMALDAPHVSGSHPFDFAVELEGSSRGVQFTGDARPGGAAPRLARAFAPLVALPDASGPGVVLRVDAHELARMRARGTADLDAFDMPELGAVTLELVRRPLPLAMDAKLAIDGEEIAGGPRALLGDLQVWIGGVAGVEGSRVFLAFQRDRVQGFVVLPGSPGGLVHVFPAGPGLVRFVGERELRALGARQPDSFCNGPQFRPGSDPGAGLGHDPGGLPTTAQELTDCRLALETDFQLFERLGSSSVALAEYVASEMAAVSELFATNVQTTLSIAYLGIHTTSDDGWDAQETSGASPSTLLTEFQSAWHRPGAATVSRFPNDGSWPVEANLAHFLSGAELGGGVAYLDSLCDPDFGFAVSADLLGSIDWGAWTGEPAPFTWDFVVVAHELGHNFNAHHTHWYCPPLDECAPERYWHPGRCQDEVRCERGTIMSYCHLACGGMANIDLTLHPVSANYMRQAVNSSCLAPATLSPGDYLQYRVRFNPLTTTGARSADLSFAHDAPNEQGNFKIRLAGIAE